LARASVENRRTFGLDVKGKAQAVDTVRLIIPKLTQGAEEAVVPMMNL